MLQGKDLMVGDWVILKSNGIVSDEIHQIVAIDGEESCCFVSDCDNRIGFEELLPIPLTPEILEKNGWKREFDKKAYMVKYDLAVEGKNCWMMWAIKEHNLDIQRQDEKLYAYNLKVQRVYMPCDFVHELQRALRCAGLFELANNFKI